MCRAYLAQLRERIDEFEICDVAVFAIAPSKASFINQFLESFGPFPFPIVGDPKRQAYLEMGHRTMPKWKLLTKAAYGFLFGKMKNFIPKDANQKQFVLKSMKTQDVYIQGGTWLYSAGGKLIWKHIDASPEDHAKLDEVLKHL